MYDDDTLLITIDELCDQLMIGQTTAYRLLKAGKIPCFRINRIWKIPRQSIEDYIRQECNAFSFKK